MALKVLVSGLMYGRSEPPPSITRSVCAVELSVAFPVASRYAPPIELMPVCKTLKVGAEGIAPRLIGVPVTIELTALIGYDATLSGAEMLGM